MSNLVDHFRRELELIDEEPEIIKMYLKVARAFVSFGHSGGSASVAIPTINELLQFKNLSPLTDDPNEWVEHDESVAGSEWKWQSKRNFEAFSKNGGKTYYLLSECETGKKKRMHRSKKVMFSPNKE